MRIQEELKLNLIEAMCIIQKPLKSPQVSITAFINECGSVMAIAETATDLAQTVRSLIQTNLSSEWWNPRWYFSTEYLLRRALLQILDNELYSILNLLIRTNREDRLRIYELETRIMKREKSSLGSHSSGTLLKAYSDRHNLDQRRIAELNTVADELVDENTQLKLAAAAAPILAKLTKVSGFADLLARADLSEAEHVLVAAYLEKSAVALSPSSRM